MFSLEGRNKLGIISSFLYFVVVFCIELSQLVKSFRYDDSSSVMSSGIEYIVLIVIGLFMVFALVKDFFKDRNLGTVFIGIFLFLNIAEPYLSPLLSYKSNLPYYVFKLCTLVLILLMSLRLFKSPNIGKIVGLIGFVYIPIFIIKNLGVYLGEYINFTIYSLWIFVFGMIPAGIYFSYFLFYEKA